MNGHDEHMRETNRLLTFPTTTDTYAEQLTDAMRRVRRAEALLRIERIALEQLLLRQTTETPEGRTH